MRYTVRIKTNRGTTIHWINGGVGYTEEELKRVMKKIANDKRIVEYKVIEKNEEEEKEMAKEAQVSIIEIEVEGIKYTQTRPGYYYKRVDDKNVRIPKSEWEQAFDAFTAQVDEADEEFDAEDEIRARKDLQDAKDRETEQNFNGGKHEDTLPDGFTMKSTWDGDTYSYALYRGEELIGRFWDSKEAIAEAHKMLKAEKPKTKKAAKPRRSKDVAFEMDTIEGHITLTAKQVQFLKLLPKTCFWEEGVESTLWCDCIAEGIGWNPMSVGAMISTLREKKLVTVAKDTSREGNPKCMTFTAVGQVIAEKLGLH